GSADLSGSLNLGSSFTDVPGGTANWSFTGGTNYTDQNGSVAIVINKATASLTLSDLSYTYDGTAKTATVTTTPSGLAGVSLLGGGQTNAGTYPLTASLTNPNYTAPDATADLVIDKAIATVLVNGYTGTYDAAAHGATGTATGVGGTDLSGSLNLGSSFTDAPGGTANWSFLGGTNYTDQSGLSAININKAVATITVNGYTGTFDGTAHSATGTAFGIGGANLIGSLNLGSSFTDVPGGTANWSFTGGTNYTDQSGSVAIVISKATATVTVAGYTGTYDGAAHGATGTATGIGGGSVGSLDLGASFTDAPGGTATWSFTGGTNYTDQSGSVAITINKAAATLALSNLTHTYDGTAKTATVTTSPVGLAGVSLSGGNQTNAGSHPVTASLSNINYTASDATGTLVINKATPTISLVVGGPYTYDGAAKSVTSAVVNGVSGPIGAATLVYSPAAAPTDAGSYNVTADYAETANYVAATQQTGTLVINKAVATVTVNGYTGTYDGATHGATGTATGVGGGSVGTLNLGASFTNAPGGTANWTFTGGTNYTDQSGSVAIVINKKVIIVTAAAKTKVYGTADPALTYTFSPALISGDSFAGALTRVAGEDVANNPYAIQQGSLALSSNYTINYVGANLTITPQMANPLAESFYTGSIFFWTPSSTNSTATLTLAATVKNAPNYGGDIRTARVSFFIRTGTGRTPIAGAQNLPVGLVNAGDQSVGSAAATVQYNLGNANVTSLEIGIEVSGNYRVDINNPQYDKIITVAKPVPGGQIVGGVDLDAATAAGYVKGTSNLSFNVQYNKSLKNPQGTVEAIVISPLNKDGVVDNAMHTYRLKSNAISVLATGKPTPNDAQFTSKANISEVVNGVDQAIEGNCTMQFDMKAGSSDGPAGDEVAITVYRAKGGIWYSNSWNGTQTVLKQIVAGNVSVSGGSTGARVGVDETGEPTLQLIVAASPNPTTGLLTISVKGAGDQPSVKIRLYNLMQGVSGEWALNLQDGQGQKTIDIQSANEGMYFLSVEGKNGRAVQRILKGN
ncbi:MAG: T9SS type A sorting domain-containing protein, partial [Cytophagaceae bacterium]